MRSRRPFGISPRARSVGLALVIGVLGAPAAAARLPSPTTTDPVQSLALAGDGGRLVLFYCAFDVSLNQDPGVVLEWNGSSWTTVSSHVTSQCHDPDVVVDGAEAGGLYLTDGQDLGAFCLGGDCDGGADIDQDGLRNVHDPRIGWAFGFPYATYTQFQGPFAEDRLWIDQLYPLIDPFANPPETTGAFHCFESSCEPLENPTLAGTSQIVYAAYDVPSGDCMGVRWETQSSFGDYLCIQEFPGSTRRFPEVAVVNNHPVVMWRESHDGLSSILGGEYTGPATQPGNLDDWVKIEQLDSSGSPWDHVRVASTGTGLFTLYRRGSELTVRHWDGGSTWTTLWSESLSPYPSSPDIGVYQGNAYVAWVSGDGIEVETVPEPSAVALAAAAALTLAWIGRRGRA